ncbi:MAG: hypothetical protein ABIR54_09095 [Burkholderiaceae bacterium]
MPQTYNVGSRSRFVNFVAWIFILLAAFACEWAVIQNATQSWASLAVEPSSLPWLTGLLVRHAAWVFSAAVALSMATMVCAFGLLRRIEWARRVFIGLLMVAIGVDLAGLWLQQEVTHLLVDSTLRQAALTQPAADLFGGILTAARLLAGLITLGVSLGLVGIIRRLMSPSVRQEFA